MYVLVPFSDDEVETGEVGDLGDPGVDPEILELHFAAEMPENDIRDGVFPRGEEDADVDVEQLDAPLLLFPGDEVVFDDLDGEDIEFRHEDPDLVGDDSSDEDMEDAYNPWFRIVPADVEDILADFNISDHEEFAYSDSDEEEEEEED